MSVSMRAVDVTRDRSRRAFPIECREASALVSALAARGEGTGRAVQDDLYGSWATGMTAAQVFAAAADVGLSGHASIEECAALAAYEDRTVSIVERGLEGQGGDIEASFHRIDEPVAEWTTWRMDAALSGIGLTRQREEAMAVKARDLATRCRERLETVPPDEETRRMLEIAEWAINAIGDDAMVEVL